MTAPAPTFDRAAFKRAAREQWQHHAEAWDRWAPALESWLRPVTETIIELAHVREGHAVLDVAAGAGEPAVTRRSAPEMSTSAPSPPLGAAVRSVPFKVSVSPAMRCV